MDAIHAPGVFGWIEQPDVDFVHVQVVEPSVIGARSQHSAAMPVVFDGSNGVVSKDEVGEQSDAGSGKQVQGSHEPLTLFPSASAQNTRSLF